MGPLRILLKKMEAQTASSINVRSERRSTSGIAMVAEELLSLWAGYVVGEYGAWGSGRWGVGWGEQDCSQPQLQRSGITWLMELSLQSGP